MEIKLPELAAGRSSTGEMGMEAVQELQKALTAGYGTDVASLTGGGALRIQSLERTLLSTIQENKHFKLFNQFAKTSATATVDEWTEQSGVGGFMGGSTNSETGVINDATGSYARRTGQVKYLMTRREVSFVTTLQNSQVEAEATEQQNGALQLLTDAEFLSFEGDSAVVPTEFDGIYAQLAAGIAAGQVDQDNILDARGQSLNSIGLINKAAAGISRYGNFGTPTHMFHSQLVQADFDTGLDPAFRVSLSKTGQDIMVGAPVVGVRTSHGNIATEPDVFIREDLMLQPFEVRYPAIAAANAFVPASVTPGSPATDLVNSQFSTAQAGNYYYLVSGVNAKGESMGVVSAQVAIGPNQKVALTIARSVAATETGYVIYRSRQNGLGVVAGSVVGEGSDFRQVARIPIAGATTVWTDTNADIPGTTKSYILNMTPSAMAITWRQLLPMLKFPLYPTQSAVIPWAQLLFGYLRIGKRKHHVVIKNILPNGNVWRPFV
ncbi:hypothetical protein [Parvibaculum sp.]|uniref:hypothetical protein n=1 Tax=Parvibaculum sp. TaxID=2024848 RepID=UPI00273248FD|nr:hypothetical protein [Parvibaculum sp.]MDP3327191.1 hypothetical protein [Parvibaculum sp.]